MYAVGRDAAKLRQNLGTYLEDLGADASARVVDIVADVTTASGATEAWTKIGAHLNGATKVDVLISSSGPWWKASPLHELDATTFDEAVAANLSAHFYVWRAFAKHVSKSYILVNGAAMNYLPRVGLTGVLANALHGLISVFVNESPSHGFRCHEYLISARVADGEGPKAVPTKKFGGTFLKIAEGDVEGATIHGDEAFAQKYA